VPDSLGSGCLFFFEAHRLVYHSTLGLRVIKKKKKKKVASSSLPRHITIENFRTKFFALKVLIDSELVGEVSRAEKMLYSGTDPESYITEYYWVNENWW